MPLKGQPSPFKGKKLPQIGRKGRIPWNRGLTKENSSSVMKYALIKIIPREVRTCACGCNETFECKTNSLRKYINHHSNRGIKFSEEIRKKRLARRTPSYYEGRLINLIEEHKLPYKYVGNGQVWIGRYNPDFININGQKTLIEVYGKFQKLRGYGTVENYEMDREKHYKQYGFDTIFFNQDNLFKRDEDIIQRLSEAIS